MPIPRGERAARVQACSSPKGRQGVGNTVAARMLYGSCTGSCTLHLAPLAASLEAGRDGRP